MLRLKGNLKYLSNLPKEVDFFYLKGCRIMIRILNKHDAENYWELRLQALQTNPEAFATTYEEAIKRKNPIEATAQNLDSENSYTFGAFNENDKLVGVVTLLLEQLLVFKHKGSIMAMYVDPSKRGQGYAKQLLQEVIAQGKELGLEQLLLTVVSTNDAAKSLYNSLDFRTYGLEKRALKIGDTYSDEEYMVRFL